ncbi:chlorophyllase-2, chloroplastic [Iris pallida]|uniref:Chlorophyllase-2, chloroplastic n=1 Tax=Iris pallida TaxID=29817 RepID=A0AAX6GDR1_IRIPA|nr:chlorophyllase-2, chloroplastic [Iris pallida]
MAMVLATTEANNRTAVPMVVEPSTAAASLFSVGDLTVEFSAVKSSKTPAWSPPVDITVASPLEKGLYPLLMFLHGYMLSKDDYRKLLQHIASHGYIVVAPQSNVLFPCSQADITGAAATTNWLPTGLQYILPKGVKADLEKLALSGHSRGGHAAFALALGHAETDLKFSALLGIDPVAGPGPETQIPPKILTNQPSSFALDMPVLVVGSGLGEKKRLPIFPACAPEGVNHAEFYYECKTPCYYFVVSDYGHMDMLDDDAAFLMKCLCAKGTDRDLMRRSIGGLVVAFLKACLEDDKDDLQAILGDPDIAPAKLNPVDHRI